MMPRQWVVRVSTLLILASSLTSLKGQPIDALTGRLIACADSAHKLMSTNHNSEAFTLLNTALQGPLRHQSKLGTSHLLYEMARLERKRGHLDQSLLLLKQADTLAIQTHRIRLLGRINYALSVVYTDLGDYATAINYCYRTLQYNDKENDRIPATYGLLREIHQHMGNDILSLNYAEQALRLMSRSTNPEDRIIYFITMAERKAREKKYPEALAYMNKAATFTPLKFGPSVVTHQETIYVNIALFYLKMGNWQLASVAINKAAQWEKVDKSFISKAYIYLRMADIQVAQRHYHHAMLLASRAVRAARLSHRPDVVLMTLDSLQHLQFLDGQHQAAWLTAQRVRQLSDSLASVAKTKAVADLDTRYKVAAKEATIQELRNEATIQKLLGDVRQRALKDANQQQTRLLWIAFSLTFGMVGVGFMLWRSQQLQQETEEQRQLLESQATELQELSYYKDKLFGMVSHDLRVPVIALKRIVAGKQTYPTVDEWHTFRATLTTHIEQFYTLVNNVLYWSLGQRGQVRLKVNLFFLDELIADSIETLSAEISQKRLVLVNHVAHEPLVVDENTTGLVLRNLLHNAIKFTPVGGTITLRSLRNDDKLVLMIRDTGPGLTATRHQRNNKLSSTGLGLAVSEELMTLSGGELRIDEVEPHGTEVVLSWPLAA
ncbi:tetratricopeptide repeat-containing sensor histidine kinase [Spirosoma radiotolerans]|uniref:histidine kinase n=1 Tax=Spirosoma radiotolerans TaxID=1379870 RepID=A0A0E3ZRR8_9BACT|nr:ATP-binding protein [Spirosoma radiotolerans]AKD53803.1 hypothetical protein SD10_01685 [Spirosoma radiotolerans]